MTKANRERSLNGSKFKIQLWNKLAQRASAREHLEWVFRKANPSSNKTKSPMQQFPYIQRPGQKAAGIFLQSLTVDGFGCPLNNYLLNIAKCVYGTTFASTHLQLLDQTRSDLTKLEDMTEETRDYTASPYQKNQIRHVLFLMFCGTSNDLLSDNKENVLPKDHTGYQGGLGRLIRTAEHHRNYALAGGPVRTDGSSVTPVDQGETEVAP